MRRDTERNWDVTAADGAGVRLDLFLAARVGGLTRSRIVKGIEAGRALVGGAPRKASYRLRAGERVAFAWDEDETPAAAAAEDIPVTVLHADADIVVLDKPSGLVVHPGAGVRKGTLVNALLARFPELRGVGETDRPGIVHRLDKETSGVMVVARNEKALRSLQAQFKSRQVRKTYLALVWGKMPAREGRLDRPIGRHVSHGQRMSVKTRRPRTAETQYAVLEVFPETSFLEVRPLTGRTHQIRVHMAAAGHPVVGDSLYGRRKEKRAGRMFLHAHKLSFLHPASGERVEFVSPLAADLEAARTAFSS